MGVAMRDGVVHRVVVRYPGQFRERHETLCGLPYRYREARETRRWPVDCIACLDIEAVRADPTPTPYSNPRGTG